MKDPLSKILGAYKLQKVFGHIIYRFIILYSGVIYLWASDGLYTSLLYCWINLLNGLNHIKEVDKKEGMEKRIFTFNEEWHLLCLLFLTTKVFSILFINFKDQTRRYMIQWTKKTDILTFSQQLLNLLHADWKIRQRTNMLALCN